MWITREFIKRFAYAVRKAFNGIQIWGWYFRWNLSIFSKKKDSISNDRTQRSGEAAHAVLVLRQNNYKYTAVGHQRFTIKVCIKYYLCWLRLDFFFFWFHFCLHIVWVWHIYCNYHNIFKNGNPSNHSFHTFARNFTLTWDSVLFYNWAFSIKNHSYSQWNFGRIN